MFTRKKLTIDAEKIDDIHFKNLDEFYGAYKVIEKLNEYSTDYFDLLDPISEREQEIDDEIEELQEKIKKLREEKQELRNNE